ncbi:MAG: hypothetical protein OEU95_04990, partial [Nitrospirota bacterium]|nr:hypothetical protein [Nitrospirota bacterium]
MANKTEREISLVITDNSSTMLSLRKENRRTVLRLHRMFLSADGNVLEEIADFIKGRKKKTPGIRDYIDRNAHLLKKGLPRKVNVRPEGKYYNLLDIYHSVNEEYFEGRVSAS